MQLTAQGCRFAVDAQRNFSQFSAGRWHQGGHFLSNIDYFANFFDNVIIFNLLLLMY
jgi:hypothetical protein